MTALEILEIYKKKPIWVNPFDAKVYRNQPESNLFFYGMDEMAGYETSLSALESMKNSGMISAEALKVVKLMLDQILRERNAKMGTLRRTLSTQRKSMQELYQAMCLHRNNPLNVVKLINGIKPEWVRDDVEGLKLLLFSFASAYTESQKKEVCQLVVKAIACKVHQCKEELKKGGNNNIVDSSKEFKKFEKNDDEDSDEGPSKA